MSNDHNGLPPDTEFIENYFKNHPEEYPLGFKYGQRVEPKPKRE